MRLWAEAARLAGIDMQPYRFRRLLAGGADILHFNWPDAAVSDFRAMRCVAEVAKLFLQLAVARLRGVQVLWTVHNLKSHERLHPFLEALMWRVLTRQVRGLVSLSEAGRTPLVERFPRLRATPVWVVRHGDYRPILNDKVDRQGVRAVLGVDDAVTLVGLVGTMRTYKRPEHLMERFSELADPRARLLVAGEVGKQLTDVLRERAGRDSRIIYQPGVMSDEEIEGRTTACDLVVLPYDGSLNSGLLLYALSCGRPVLAARTPVFQEIAEEVGSSWVSLYEGDLTPQVLAGAIAWARQPSRPPARLTAFDWTRIGAAAGSAYRELAARSRRRPAGPTESVPTLDQARRPARSQAERRGRPAWVSVVVPIRNGTHVFERQLAALSAQTYQGQWEIVLVDNGSTDDLHIRLPSWCEKESRLRCVEANARPGVSYARNVGCRAARGELIAICDADDEVASDWLDRMVAAAADSDVVAGGLSDARINVDQVRGWRARAGYRMLPSRFGFLPYAHGCNVAVWSDVVADIGGWDEEFVGGGDDVDFSWRAQLAGYRLVHAPAAVAYYRQRTSLAGLAKQMYGYGRADARLLRRFAPFGAQARPFGAFVHSMWWLGSRLPFAGMDNSRRGRWVASAALQAGRLHGSLAFRTWCP